MARLNMFPMSGPARRIVTTYLKHTQQPEDSLTVYDIALAEILAYNLNINFVITRMCQFRKYATKNAKNMDYYYLGFRHNKDMFRSGIADFDDMGTVCMLLYKRLVRIVTCFDIHNWEHIKELSRMDKEAVTKAIGEVRERFANKLNIAYITAVARSYDMQIRRTKEKDEDQFNGHVSDLQLQNT